MTKKQIGTRHTQYYFDAIEELRTHFAKQGKIYTKAEIVENALDLLVLVEIDKKYRLEPATNKNK